MTSLCIGGGSYKGFCFLGALDYLYKRNYLSLLKNFYGTSIGAIIGILFIIGITPLEILKFFLDIEFKELWDFNFNNINSSYSLISNKFFTYYMFKFFEQYENTDITIKQFIKKYEIEINIYATSIKKRKLINFNSEEYENTKVLDALTASASIPIVFPPVIINDEYFVDGCLKAIDGVIDEIIDGYTIKFDYKVNKIENFLSYINEILMCGTTYNKTIKSNINTLVIDLPKVFENKYNFNDVKNSDKIELYYEGLIQAQKFYK